LMVTSYVDFMDQGWSDIGGPLTRAITLPLTRLTGRWSSIC
jgi:hypothetical protein